MSKLIYLVPLFPLIGFLVNGLGRKSLSKSIVSFIGVGSVLASFVVSLLIFSEVRQPGFTPQVINFFDFIKTAKLHIPFAIQSVPADHYRCGHFDSLVFHGLYA
jgi:NADH-quinone oxidoreductase subunit L